MTFVPHYRVSLNGFLGQSPGADIWQANLSLDRFGEGSEYGLGLDAPGIIPLEPNEAVWTDLRDDAVAWFTRATSRIRSNARLATVKIAHIGADGKYLRPPIELSAGNVQGGEGFGPIFPFQCAVAHTLGTDGDLGRVKGRFYSPAPSVDIDPNTGLIPVAQQTEMRESVDQFLTDLGNAPAWDVLGLKVCVASQGRRNSDGSVKAPPRNYEVVRTSTGRAVDTIRSRRSALREFPVYAGVDQGSM